MLHSATMKSLPCRAIMRVLSFQRWQVLGNPVAQAAPGGLKMGRVVGLQSAFAALDAWCKHIACQSLFLDGG